MPWNATFVFSSFPFPFSPKWTFKLAPQYVAELPMGSLTFSADATYTSTYYTYEIPDPFARVRPMVLLNASVKFEDPSKKYYVIVYGHNLTNKHYIQEYTTPPNAPGTPGLFSIAQDNKPITWGVTVGARF